MIKNSTLGKQTILVGTACHKLLQLVCHDNQDLQMYIASNHMDAIQNHLGGPVKAADTLAAVYTNNIKLVQQVRLRSSRAASPPCALRCMLPGRDGLLMRFRVHLHSGSLVAN